MIRYKHIELDWCPGRIYNLTADAIQTAKDFDCRVTFPFNGIKITVDNNSHVDYIANKALDHVSGQLGDIE